MIFSDIQVEQLLKGLHPSRVKFTQGQAYLEQHDVRAHLNRIFGFGNWDQKLTRLGCVFEAPTVILDKETKRPKPNRWDACYYASIELTVRGVLEDGGWIAACSYEDGATGDAQNQTRAEAHDLALKSAISTALKRAATSLGDQFGLSLYASGSLKPLVRGVIGWEPPKPDDEPATDGEQTEIEVGSDARKGES